MLVIALGAIALASCDDDGGNNSSASPTAAATTSGTPVDATGTSTPSDPASTRTPEAVTGDITVFAAASLTAPFEEIQTAFEAANAGTAVTYNFAGSPALRTQLTEGASADVYASADTTNMEQALEDDLVVDGGTIFAKNRLAVIVPKGDPGGITGLVDLGNAGVTLIFAQPEVPVGKYAREVIQNMQDDGSYGEGFYDRVIGNIVSEEPNVKAVVTKIQLGEADAGIVYVTDVTTEVAEDVTLIEIPDNFNVIAEYPIAITANASNTGSAQAFIAFVLSEEGQAILAKHGFLPVE
jgi:molybdate transport system substrate-binding protein